MRYLRICNTVASCKMYIMWFKPLTISIKVKLRSPLSGKGMYITKTLKAKI